MTQQSMKSNLRNMFEYRELRFQIVKYPVCSEEALNDHRICKTYGWEYDGTTKENAHFTCIPAVSPKVMGV